MYVSSGNNETYLEMTAFARRIEKFRAGLVPGMTLTVFLETGDKKVDNVPRKAKVVKVYENFCLLQDDKGLMYGPTYHKLIEWGNT